MPLPRESFFGRGDQSRTATKRIRRKGGGPEELKLGLEVLIKFPKRLRIRVARLQGSGKL